MIGASLVAVPALADEATNGNGATSFAIAQPNDPAVDPANTAYAVSGVGCTGQDAQVIVGLVPPGGNDADLSRTVTVTPSADGSWSTTLNIPEQVAGGDTAKDGWSVAAACGAYNQQTALAGYPVFFDNTEVTGNFTITSENGATTFNVELSGLSAGETARLTLNSEPDQAEVAELGSITINADGTGTGSFPAPALPDGTYRLVIVGSRYGEGASSTKLIQVSGGTYSTVDDANQDGGSGDSNSGGMGGGTTTNTGDAGSTEAGSTEKGTTVSVTAGATHAAGAKTDGKDLARTGTNGLLIGGGALALLAVGGGVLVARRRKA
ncbi:hypothetical protein [Actinomyces slackii]|nr:hypothetical protein [Actinomyces slackii]